MAVRILVVDDESDVEVLFRQQFRRELRDGRFDLSFANPATRPCKGCSLRTRATSSSPTSTCQE